MVNVTIWRLAIPEWECPDKSRHNFSNPVPLTNFLSKQIHINPMKRWMLFSVCFLLFLFLKVIFRAATERNGEGMMTAGHPWWVQHAINIFNIKSYSLRHSFGLDDLLLNKSNDNVVTVPPSNAVPTSVWTSAYGSEIRLPSKTQIRFSF